MGKQHSQQHHHRNNARTIGRGLDYLRAKKTAEIFFPAVCFGVIFLCLGDMCRTRPSRMSSQTACFVYIARYLHAPYKFALL